MIAGIIRTLAGLALMAASAAFLTAVSLLLFGSFLLTWPIMRKSPRDAKLRATTDLAAAAMVALSTFQRDRMNA